MTTANGSPAKRFFVEMLTRDIELADAILDLLDNCVDGALRAGATDSKLPYKGFSASIELSSKLFQIQDNCGGIPRSIAEKYAFRFGRKERERDKDLATVGVYGIGMKRAIFKLGTNCVIDSKHDKESFSVTIDQDWINNDENWSFDMSDTSVHQKKPGTTIRVDQLHPQVQIAFSAGKDGFVDNFSQIVQRHYSYIIEKGFEILVNDKRVSASTIQTLLDPASYTSGAGISPYLYQTKWDGVDVELAMGLYEQLPTEQEQEESEKGTRNKESAGWTIICNDRVVVAADKTRLTGWGEAGVPAYHSQFIALAGVVTFRSTDAIKLPVTTTKRGIDQNSELFGQVKEVMREALKHFTSFTNKWKSQTTERDDVQRQAKSVDIRTVAMRVPDNSWKEVRKGIGGKKFVPPLPAPQDENKTRRIQFVRSIEEIALIGSYLLDDSKATPADVGVATFEWVLKKAQRI
jgi:hypothetical protein